MMLKKFRQTHHFNWYIGLWLAALLIILYLAKNWYFDKKFIGIVETRSHAIGAQESGQIQNLLITVGDPVKQGQLLAILDVSDLKTTLEQLKNELNRFQQLEGARRNRYSIEAQRMALQLENEAAEIADRLSMIESKSTELAVLNTEIERLKNAEKAGLGQSRDLPDLILQRDALASYLKEQSKDLEFQTQKLEKTRQTRRMLEAADIDSLSRAMLLEQQEYTESLQHEINEIEHRIRLRTLVAPCDGLVTEMYARTGDVVDAFIPILAVEELKPGYLDVFIPEQSRLQPEPGMQVEIFSARSRNYNTTGIITFVHPGFAMASERLSFRGQLFWARKARVELPKNHQLIPGEVVNARIRKTTKRNADFLAASAVEKNNRDTKNPVEQHPPLRQMQVDQTLWNMTRFEPSGVAWLPDIGKYLIVSDDTGIRNTPGDHAAWIFLMDENGKVDSAPVPLIGIETVNDLEVIAPAGTNTFYLVSSQNISKRNKRPGSRELIIKISRQDGKYLVQEQVQFLSLLVHSYSKAELSALGLDQFEPDGQPVLNIEGAAFRDQALYLGLKEPVAKNGAIIWKLENVAEIFNAKKLQPNQLSVYGYVQLGQYQNKTAGISDLMFDQNGIMWALSTCVNADKDQQLGGLHRINRFADGRLEATRIFSFPGLKPEGMGLQNRERFLIVFDQDNEKPLFCYIDAKELKNVEKN